MASHDLRQAKRLISKEKSRFSTSSEISVIISGVITSRATFFISGILNASGLLSPLGQFATPQGTVRAVVIPQRCAGNLMALPVTGAWCRMFLCLGHFQCQDSLGVEEVSP